MAKTEFEIAGTSYKFNADSTGISATKHRSTRNLEFAAGIFAAAAVGCAIATPFTGAVLAIPTLVCALVALGLVIAIVVIKNQSKIENYFDKRADALLARTEIAADIAAARADEKRKQTFAENSSNYKASANAVRERQAVRKAEMAAATASKRK